MTDSTIIKYPNSGGYLLQNWIIRCNDKNSNGKIQNFIRSSKSNSPTSDSGATALPPIGDSFMYIETTSNNHGSNNIFVSWERTDIIQIRNITFYYNRFSISDVTIAKNDQYSNNSTDWTLLNLNFTVENYGVKLIYDQIDTPHADMCFSNVSITHSVY